MIGLLAERVREKDCRNGFILSGGFPRSTEQAKALDTMLSETGDAVSSVISIEVPDEKLENRICGRWLHKASGH